MEKVRLGAVAAILVLAICVAAMPGVVYARTPRVILYFLISLTLAIFFGSEAAAQLRLSAPGFCFACGGAAALCFAGMWFLTQYSKPEEKIAVYNIYDEENKPVDLQWKGAFTVPLTSGGLQVTNLATGNTLILIFPEQAAQTEVRVKKESNGPEYVGTVGYAGSRTSTLKLGKDLLTSTPR